MIDEERRRQAGAQAEVRMTNLTVRKAVNLFLAQLDNELDTGKIGKGHRGRYGFEIDLFIRRVGRNRKLADFCRMTAPDELFRPLREAAMKRGVYAAEKHIVMVRGLLDWCSRTRRFIPAPFYADAFDPPGEKEKKARAKSERRKKGIAFWKPAEVREIVEAARLTDVHRYAQVLLMLNGGMGEMDLSELTDAAIDWDRRCIHTDRSKTLVPRVVPLWDETIAAMRASRAVRAEPADPQWAPRFFLTRRGRPIVVESLPADRKKPRRSASLRNWFYRLLNAQDRKHWKAPAVRLRHLKRHRAGGYTLRSVFATLTLGRGTDKNLEAIILGQQFERPILEFYVRDDQRAKLVQIVEHVRKQIWPDQ
jgi:hypothetical protein